MTMKNCGNCDHEDVCGMTSLYETGCEWWCGWHDLRKDPKDLPEDSGVFVVAYNFRGSDKVYTCNEHYYKETYFHVPNEVTIIAWHEIPTFDNDDD